jgi:hypothetical protein
VDIIVHLAGRGRIVRMEADAGVGGHGDRR